MASPPSVRPPAPDALDAESQDRRALQSCRNGDMDGLRHLYESYGPRVMRTARRLLQDPHLAEDATQEVFVRIHRGAAGFRGDARVSTWIYRMAVNQCLNMLDGQRRRGRWLTGLLPSHDAPVPPADHVASGDGRRARELLGSLPPDARAVLVLREIEGLSYREIADVLSLPIGTVMSRLARARQELRQRFLGNGAPDALPRRPAPAPPAGVKESTP